MLKVTVFWLDQGSIRDIGRDFFLYQHVQISSGVHLSSYPVATNGPFLGGKGTSGRNWLLASKGKDEVALVLE